MSTKNRRQGPKTRRFQANEDGATFCHTGVYPSHRTAIGLPREDPEITVHPGRGGYVWIGSREKGCYTHIPLTTLKRLIADAETP